jgi:hypothetical protein
MEGAAQLCAHALLRLRQAILVAGLILLGGLHYLGHRH